MPSEVGEYRFTGGTEAETPLANGGGKGTASPREPHKGGYVRVEEVHITWFAAITTYFGYAVLICFGHIRDFFGRCVKSCAHVTLCVPIILRLNCMFWMPLKELQLVDQDC
jgi:hypothetical protein